MELEQVWNFYVKQDFEFERDGNDFFAERATKLPEAIGYQMESVQNVELKIDAGLKWFVTGNVRLSPANRIFFIDFFPRNSSFIG